MYEGWIKDLLQFCRENNLRIDFVSYHRYSADVGVFSQDYQKLQNVLNDFPEYINLPIIITEWGSDSENSRWHDGNFDAVHTLAAVRQMLDRIQMAFSFEIKDGPSDKEFWGRWGLITHDKFGLHKKPRYYALKLLNTISGQRIKIDGEGGYVTGFGAKEKENLKIILINYDIAEKHSENVPVMITNLQNGNYSIKTTFLSGKVNEEFLTVENSSISKTYFLPAQSVVLIEITKLSPSHTFSLGYFGIQNNWGLLLSKNSLPLTIPKEQFAFPPEGNMDFFIKPLWAQSEDLERTIFYLPLSEGKSLILKKRTLGFNKSLEFGTYMDGEPENIVSASISGWTRGSWHHIGLSWGPNGLKIFLDGKKINQSQTPLAFNLPGVLTFNNFDGVIDELRIINTSLDSLNMPSTTYNPDDNTLYLRHFDRSVDQ
jgi:hypothetical protein